VVVAATASVTPTAALRDIRARKPLLNFML
jgi:hypothetical protein